MGGREFQQAGCSQRHGFSLQDLGADVRVQAHEFQVGAVPGLSQGALGRAGVQRETEFGIERAGLAIVVSVDVDPWRKAQPDGNPLPPLGKQPLQHSELVEVVYHDTPHAPLQGGSQLGRGLVVAVEVDPLGWKPGLLGHVELAAGDHVQAQSLLRKELGQGQVEISLAGICHLAPARIVLCQSLPVGSTPAAQGRIVKDVKRRAVLLRQGRCQASSQPELPLLIHASARRKKGQRFHRSTPRGE